MNYLKGIKYPFESVINTIKWLQEKNFKIKIQPTLWPINYQESYDIIAFFANLGIDWFTFHIGSNETNTLDTHRHLNEEELHEVHRLLDLASKFNVKITCPVIYESLNKNTDYDKKWYCMNIKNSNSLLAFFGEEIYVTNVPILSSVDSKYLYKLGEEIDVTELNKSCICPISGSVAKQKTICRYVKKDWN